jgi:hypothetical protein
MGVVAQVDIWEAEAGESRVQNQPGIHKET